MPNAKPLGPRTARHRADFQRSLRDIYFVSLNLKKLKEPDGVVYISGELEDFLLETDGMNVGKNLYVVRAPETTPKALRKRLRASLREAMDRADTILVSSVQHNEISIK